MEIRKNLLGSQKLHMQQEQLQYFDLIQKQLSKVDFEIGDRFSTRIEQKVKNHLQSGNLQFEHNDLSKHKIFRDQLHEKQLRDTEREKLQLHNKLKGINFELEKLKHQRIENPLSVYSQPSLKIYIEEDSYNRQEKAQNFVSAINLKQREFKSDFSRKMKEERDRHKMKQIELEELQREERLIEQSKKHERIKNHLREIKLKNENRLVEMMDFEQNYFKQLDDKLEMLRLDRLHLKNQQVDQIKIKSGVKHKKNINDDKEQAQNKSRRLISLNDLTKTLTVEKPLYQRMQNQYDKQIETSHQEYQENQDKILNNQIYRDINFEEHQQNYRQSFSLSKGKKNKVETKVRRKEDGKTQGNGNDQISKNQQQQIPEQRNISIQIKQILKQNLLNESALQKKQELKDKHQKMLTYMESVKHNHVVHISKEKQMEALIHKDKLEDQRKYITILKRKNSHTIQITDSDIFKNKSQKKQQTDDSVMKKQFNDRGNLYLSQLPDAILSIQNTQRLKNKQLLESDQTKSRIVKSSQSQQFKIHDLVKPNYLIEIEKKFHLDQKVKEKQDWQKVIANELVQSDYLNSRSLNLKPNQKDILTRDNQSEHVEQTTNQRHNKYFKTQKKKVPYNFNSQLKRNFRLMSDLEKIQDITAIVDQKANKMAQIAHAKWQIQPLRALQDEDLIDEMRLDTIQARLKILELRNSNLKL